MSALASFTTVGMSGGTSVVLAKPTSLAVGDQLVAIIGFTTDGGANDVTAPAGWSAIINSSGGHRIHSFQKTADSTDVASSNFTFTINAAETFGGCLLRLTNFGVLVGSSSINANDTTTPSPLTMTGFTPNPVRENLLFIVAAGGGGATAGSTPSMGTVALATNNPTWTEQADFSETSNDQYFAFATATRTESTATGDITSAVINPSFNATSDYSAICLAFAPKLAVTINPTPSFANGRIRTVVFPDRGLSSALTPNVQKFSQTVWTNTFKS